MSKLIGVIAEDNSDIEVVKTILSKYMANNKFKVKKFAAGGCGKLRRKCQDWVEMLFRDGCHHVLVFHDLDRNNECELRRKLEGLIDKRKRSKTIVIIPVEEMEAWLLTNMRVLKNLFNLNKMPKSIPNCEAITSPKEHLRDLINKNSNKIYLNTRHNKIIVENLSVDDLKKCESFKILDEYISDKIC